MSESHQRSVVVKALRPLHGRSMENLVGIGTPDVSFAGGWIELKILSDWPKLPDTPVRISHYTREQRIWAIKHTQAGGLILMLLCIEKTHEWVLLYGAVAASLISSTGKDLPGTQAVLRESALVVWDSNESMEDRIVEWLSAL